jgi:hypothetical protein
MFDVVGLSERCRDAADFDVSTASEDELLGLATTLVALRSMLDAAQAHVLGALQVQATTDRCFGLSTAAWVARETHADRGVIQRSVKLGCALRAALPEVDTALSKGSITTEHAQVLAAAVSNPRVAEPVADAQGVFVDCARAHPFPVFKAEVTKRVQLWDQDGGFDPARELARNRLHLTDLPDGVLGVKGEFTGEHALVVRHALDDAANRQYRIHTGDQTATPELDLPSRPTLRALGLVELIRQGLARDHDHTKAPIADVTLVIRADDPDLEQVTTPDGTPVLAEVAGPLCCDARLHPLITDRLGVPLAMGRDLRLPNPAQRRALAHRDGGCVFPGCDAPVSWCDAHHVQPWEHDGATDLDNLALLCRHHHGVTHRTGWTMTAHPDQTFTWTTPHGHTVHSQRHRGRRPPSGEGQLTGSSSTSGISRVVLV